MDPADYADASSLRPRFYGRRRGKRLRATAQGLFDTLFPRLVITLPEQGGVIDPLTLFAPPVRSLWLEVGFGGGEHVVAQAARHPHAGIIGCEPFRNGVASLLGHLAATPLDNVRIWAEDARLLFPALPDGCLDRVFVLFPDPWPKKRHQDRRFIGPHSLDLLARLMADGAELRVASDDPVYQDWAAHHLHAHPDFSPLQVTQDRSQLPDDWPVTRYEQKCLAENAPMFFRFRRVPRQA